MDLNSKNTRNDRSRSRSRSHSIEKVKKILNLLEKSPSTSEASHKSTESKLTNPKGKYPGFATMAIHMAQKPDPQTGCVNTPIYLATTYAQKAPNELFSCYDYSRSFNPTRDVLEKCIQSLEFSDYALTFSSGVSAINCVLSLLKSGDHLIYCDDAYGREVPQMRTDLIVDFVDLTNLSLVSSKLTPKTKMIFIESPTNPMMKIINISEISLLSKKHNIIIVVDNTFASPYLQSPLKLGADICVESCTKFIAGHHDVIMGSAATNSKEIYDKLFHLRTYYGYIPSPFDCYLCLRGIKTLKIRMEEHSKNGLLIAKFLKNHPKIEKVFYPGLEDHPDHELAKKQMRAFGGMLSFYLKGDKNNVRNVCQKVKLFLCAASLGGVESLITVPTSMTHTGLTLEEKSGLGIKENLIRLSVGIEDIDDLIEDLRNALE